MAVAHQFADFLASTTTAGARAIDQAKAAVLDLTTAAIAGVDAQATLASHVAAMAIWKEGTSPVWFSENRLSAAGAAFVNSTSASILDMDDGHRSAAGHPGASIIPAVLATACAYPCPPERILTAIVLGYDISVRVASYVDYAPLTTLFSGPLVGP